MRLVSIDPGFAQAGGTALACWNEGQLVAARLVRSAVWEGEPGLPLWLYLAREAHAFALHPDRVVIEMPRTYGGRAKVGDANTIIALAGLVGVLAATFADRGAKVELISVPKIPKKVTEERVHGILSQAEIKLVYAAAPRSLRHNIYDSVGIGLRVLKRAG